MKKHLLILLILISACGTLKKPNTTVSASQSNNNAAINKPDITVSANQSNSYVALKTFKGDTLGYVQHDFIDNKQKYVGKDLNTLLKDVEIPIKSYLSGDASRNQNISPNIILQFYTFSESTKRRYSPHKPVNIIIIWTPPLPMDSVNFLIKKDKGEWAEVERKYYGKQIIGDILTTKWEK